MRRMKTMNERCAAASFFVVGGVCAALALAGCSGNAAVPAADRADRASRSYASAMAELQAGRVDAAIRGFEDVIRNEPGNASAHFQLAALLEDAKKDYLGAIVHYRTYLLIRPKSDKATVAADRMKGCETRYAAVTIEKAGLDSQFAASLEKLRKEHEQCARKEAKLSQSLNDATRKIAALERDLAMRNRLLEKSGAIADDSSVAKSPKKSLRPSDADLLDDDTGDDAIASSKEIRSLRSMLEDEDRTAPSKPPLKVNKRIAEPNAQPFAAVSNDGGRASNPFADKKEKSPKRLIPETYTVEEGDTLMRISAKFYGTNHKWRDIREANKAIISPDGRIRAGQVIKLP